MIQRYCSYINTEAFRPKPYVRDIGIVLDDTMDMDRHVSHTCRLAYHHLRSIANVRNSLTTTVCETIVLSLVISRLDFGNATLYGISETLLHRLQVVQNSVARLIMRVRRREHITPIMFALHWLPVRQRIQFKILTLVYRCQNHQAPAYLSASHRTCTSPVAPCDLQTTVYSRNIGTVWSATAAAVFLLPAQLCGTNCRPQ